MYSLYIRRPYPNELYHHGIKGQKWGVRRYQNEDGSLTNAGKQRYLSKEYREELEYNTTGKSTGRSTASSTADIGRYNPNASKEWNEAMGYSEPTSSGASVDTGRYNPNASAEYNAELENNLRENVYPERVLTEQSPEEWSAQNRTKKKAVKSLIERVKDVAIKVADVAKSAVNRAKDLVSKLFRKDKSESSNSGSGAYTFTLEGGQTAYKGRR